MRWVTIFALGLAALALAGCGGGNEASSTTTTTTTTETGTTTTETTTTGETTTTTTEAIGNLGNFTTGKCKDLVAASVKMSQAIVASSGNSSDLDTVAKEFQAFAKAVPSEIRPDVQTLADAYTAYIKAISGIHLKAGQTPSADDIKKLEAAASSFNSQKVQAASQHFQAWTTSNCGG